MVLFTAMKSRIEDAPDRSEFALPDTLAEAKMRLLKHYARAAAACDVYSDRHALVGLGYGTIDLFREGVHTEYGFDRDLTLTKSVRGMGEAPGATLVVDDIQEIHDLDRCIQRVLALDHEAASQ